MAACGKCHREIIWATGPDGEVLKLEVAASYDGPGRFTLHFPAGGGRPNAIPLLRPGYFAGYRPHDAVCGQAVPV